LFPREKKVQRIPVPRDLCFPLFFCTRFSFFFLFSSQAKTVTNVVERVPGRLITYFLPSDSLIQSVVLDAVPELATPLAPLRPSPRPAPALRMP